MTDALQQEAADSRAAGRNLAEAIRRGAAIHTIDCPMRLRPNEHCVGTGPVRLMQYVETEAIWQERSGGGFGLVGMAVEGTFNAIGNSRRKAAALRQAAPQWRPIDQGQMWLTNERFAIKGSQWNNLWHEQVNMARCDSWAVELHLDGAPPIALRTSYADWWYVMMQWVAYSELTSPVSA